MLLLIHKAMPKWQFTEPLTNLLTAKPYALSSMQRMWESFQWQISFNGTPKALLRDVQFLYSRK